MEADRSRKLAMFLECLGADIDTDGAIMTLESSDWNVEDAVIAFVEAGSSVPSSSANSANALDQCVLSESVNVAANIAMIDLMTAAKADVSQYVLTKPLGIRDLEAILNCSVARNVVSQGALGVCGAASVAGALNACYEGIHDVDSVTWPDILYGHFRDRLGLNIMGRRGGRPVVTTKHIGNRHILQVVRSFPHMRAEVLIDKNLAATPDLAWERLVVAMRQKRSAVWFHTSNHYVLVQGCVGGQKYEVDSCAIFSSSSGQEAFEMIPFGRACRIMNRCAKGGYKMFRFYYDGPEEVASEEEWAAYGSDEMGSISDVEPPQPEEVNIGNNTECAVCLELLCEPLQLTCQHSFCRTCLIRVSHQRCPLCRTPYIDSFDPYTAKVEDELWQLVRRNYPQECEQRLADCAALANRLIRVRVGNRHELVENPKLSKNGKHVNRHKWTVFAELLPTPMSNVESLTRLVEKVRFKLTPYYAAWPASDTRSVRVGKNPEVHSEPFEVTRVGWGSFPVEVFIYWHVSVGMAPLKLEHELCFNRGGASAIHAIEFAELIVPAAPELGLPLNSTSSSPWPDREEVAIDDSHSLSPPRVPLVPSARRKERNANVRVQSIKLRIGNRHELVENPKRSKNGKHLNNHRWTLFVELVDDADHLGFEIGDFVEKVLFKIADYYTRWPASDTHSVRVNRNPEVRSHPFEVTRVGWGYFPTIILVTMHPSLGIAPVQFEHELEFDGAGSSTVHKIEVCSHD